MGQTFFSIMVDCSHFSLCSGVHESFDGYTLCMDGNVAGRCRFDGEQSLFFGEEVVSGSSTVGFGLDEVGGVGVYVKAHVTGVIADDSLWIGGSVI